MTLAAARRPPAPDTADHEEGLIAHSNSRRSIIRKNWPGHGYHLIRCPATLVRKRRLDNDEWDNDGWDDDESWGEDDWGSEGDWDSDSPSSPPQGIQLKPGYGQKLFMLELVNDYYADMIAQELTQSAARRKQIDERYEREMTELKEGGQYKQLELKTMANQIYGEVFAQTINKLGGQIADSHFYAWRLTLESYGRLKPALEYWKMSTR